MEKDIPVLITVEKDTEESNYWTQLTDNADVITMLEKNKGFKIQRNSWMPFYEASTHRGGVEIKDLRTGCDQVFMNCVVTPKKEIASCCGLTIEHIPEMKLGRINDLSCYQEEQKDDFLKLWLHVDGPFSILETILGKNHKKLSNIVHLCQACAILHQDEEVRTRIISEYRKHIINVGQRLNISKATEKVMLT